MKVLWLSPRWPYPDNTGARKASMALLSELSYAAEKLNIKPFQLQLVCLFDESEDLDTTDVLEGLSKTADNIYFKKPKVIFGSNAAAYIWTRVFHPTTPFTIQKYTSRDLYSKMRTWMKNRQFDFTILDGLHAGAFIDFNNPDYGKFIYRAHNVESELWRQMAARETNFIKKLVLRFEYFLSKRFEAKVCHNSRVTYTVSDLDSKKFSQILSEIKVESLPIGAAIESVPLPPAKNSETLQLLFVGRLDWEPNKAGLDWFLRKIWPALRHRRSVQLTIIGSGDGDWLNALTTPDIRILRNVPELKSYYNQCHLTLIPLFMGSGTRVKAIESGNFGRSFISTRIGVEGLPFEPHRDYLLAESADEWLELLENLKLDDARTLGENVHNITKKHFEKRALAIKLLSSLQQQ